MQISVMTFNIQHGLDYKRRDKASLKAFDEMKPEYLKKLRETKPADRKQEDPSLIDLSLTVNAVRACGAEILTLNEVRDTEEGVSDPCFTPQVQRIAEGLGWPYFYFGKAIRIEGKGLYGNGIVSRYPFLDVETIPIPDPEVQDEPTYYESRCVIKARIDVKGRPLTVLTTHMGLASSEARGAVCTILKQVTPGEPVLLMGDFNLTPESPILAPLREVFADAGELLAPGQDLSYPSDEPNRKIDYIMAAGPVRFVRAGIPAIVASDHRPHTAVIELT